MIRVQIRFVPVVLWPRAQPRSGRNEGLIMVLREFVQGPVQAFEEAHTARLHLPHRGADPMEVPSNIIQ
jgi:hypothetical protein